MTGRRRRVLALVDDLMVRSRLEAAAGPEIDLLFPASEAEAEALLREPPDLVLVGMAATSLPWERLLAGERDRGRPGPTQIIAFGPHKDLSLRERALRAGAHRVLANSAMMQALPGLLAGEPPDLPDLDGQ